MVLESGVVLSKVYYCPSSPLSLISMSRLLADGHVPRMDKNQLVVSDTRGREVLRAQSDAGLFLLAPHLAERPAAIVCPASPVRTRLSSVRIAPKSARVATQGQPVQLPVALARVAGVRIAPQSARVAVPGQSVQLPVAAHAPTRVVRSSSVRARLLAMRDIVHAEDRTVALQPGAKVKKVAPVSVPLPQSMRGKILRSTEVQLAAPEAPMRGKILRSTEVQLVEPLAPLLSDDLGGSESGAESSENFEPYSVAQCRKYRVFIQHHNRLHLSIRKLRAMASVHKIDLGKVPAELNCAACHAGKGHRIPLKAGVSPGVKVGAADTGDRILYDSRELTVAAWDNLRHVSLLKSQKHGYFWIILARTKDELPAKLIQWGEMYEAHYSLRHGPIKFRRHDHGTDIDTLVTQNYWASVGTVQDAMPVYPGGVNGGSERSNWIFSSMHGL